MKKILFLTIYIFLSTRFYADDFVNKININSQNINDALLVTDDPMKGFYTDTALTSLAIAAWGFNQWNWGTESFHTHNEGWFEKTSKTGGSDKSGHFFTSYLLSRMVASRMEDRGMELQEASMYGALSSLISMTLLEIGDGTSPYGFSKEDWAADAIGVISAYFIRAYPEVDAFLDVRVEYLPSSGYGNSSDWTTDYSGMRHLVAFKLSGFEALRDTPLSLIEVQTGFYSRGFRSYDTMEESQHIYVGVGISLSDIARRSKINVLKNLFEFYQPGHTYMETDLWSRP